MLPFLRSVELHFDTNPLTSHLLCCRSPTPISHRSQILEQIRTNAPYLQCLTLSWDETLLLGESRLPWSTIQQLNIRLSVTKQDDPAASVIERVITSEVFPQLRYLSFGGRRFKLTPPEMMVKRVFTWLDVLILSLPTLATLHINRRCGVYRSRPHSSIDTCLILLQQYTRLNNHHHPSTRVFINADEEILISL